MEVTSSLSDKLFQLKTLCGLYEKYVTTQKIKSTEPQIKHQVGLACSDLYDEFILIKNKSDSRLLPVDQYVKELRKPVYAIDIFQ